MKNLTAGLMISLLCCTWVAAAVLADNAEYQSISLDDPNFDAKLKSMREKALQDVLKTQTFNHGQESRPVAREAVISKTGAVVFQIDPHKTASSNFVDGIICLQNQDKGYSLKNEFVNTKGTVIGSLYGYNFGTYSDGLIPVMLKDGWAYATCKGELKIRGNFVDARSFSGGFAAVKVKGKGWGYIDKRGIFVTPPIFDDCLEFSENMAAVWKNGKVGFLNQTGKLAIPCRFERARSFSCGLARVYLRNPSDSKLPEVLAQTFSVQEFFIDKLGRRVFTLDDIVKTQMALVDEAHRMVAFKILSANLDFSSAVSSFSSFSCGRLPFVDKDGKWGFLSTDGKTAIAPRYDKVLPFADEMAGVCIADRWGFIDKAGSLIIPLKYKSVHSFSENYAGVCSNDGAWRFIDKTGREVIPYGFKNVSLFSCARARVSY
ncbi:MAG: WG repeat-containing protein [Candidatus Melainabacteria bacterium]|nr:WG repeat-containing protein [Candidatus Melainabacteria bacterium]